KSMHKKGRPASDPSSAAPLHHELQPGTLRHLEKELKKQWKRYRKKLKRCQERFSEKAVHASRVETRRLLAAVELLASFLPARRVEAVRRALKQHLDVFDALRDTQVQLLAIGKMRRAFPAARPFYDYLLERESLLARQTCNGIRDVKAGHLRKLIAVCRREFKKRRKDFGSRRA